MVQCRWWMLGVIGTLGLAWTAPAKADDGAAQPAAGTSEARDVVRLKNGGLLRGTISELIPGDSVTIITASGKTREFPMSEVDYAGPADKDPAQQAPAATVPAATEEAAPSKTVTTTPSGKAETSPEVTITGDRANLKLESAPPGLTFHRANSSAIAAGAGGVAVARGYQRLCTAPCEVSLPAGTEVLALSKDNGFPREAEAVTLPAGTSRVTGSFESRAGLRIAGWGIMAAGAIIGGYLAFTSSEKENECIAGSCYETSKLNTPQLLAGSAIFGLGVGIGIVLAVRPDVAKVDVAMRARALSLPPARGFTLSGTM